MRRDDSGLTAAAAAKPDRSGRATGYGT